MSYSVLPAGEAFWRPSNQMGVLNTDLTKQLGAPGMGARFWRLRPGEASTRHRHYETHEVYVLIEGTGRIRIDEQLLELPRLSSVYVSPDSVRQVFNDTDADALWLVFGAPHEAANTLEMSEETVAYMYPDGPKALPPELEPS
jgi:quercetin dioxygenase-like cupin family protein